ncbi:MAG TPA: ACT domain-containing protein [Capillimicrobium sp.]|jgi:hypothetical protein
MAHALTLQLLPDRLAVARLDAEHPVPAWAFGGPGFVSVTRRAGELSVTCAGDRVPEGVRCWRGLRALEVPGPLDFDLTGVLASLAAPLAEARVWIFALATYDTDVVLVKEAQLDDAVAALERAGHRVSRVS